MASALSRRKPYFFKTEFLQKPKFLQNNFYRMYQLNVIATQEI